MWGSAAETVRTTPLTLMSSVRTSTSAGLQFNDEITRATSAYGQNILTGTSSLSGATRLFAVDEANAENKTLGAYVQEQVAWRERSFPDLQKLSVVVWMRKQQPAHHELLEAAGRNRIPRH